MIVTNLKYHLETRLVNKLDIMIKRCTNKTNRKDAMLMVEGSEGEGKTNSSVAIAHYIQDKTGRKINMFFRLAPLMEFAQSNDNQIIIWDEPALDSLATDWYRQANKDMIRLLMTCRKKRHFFIFNFVKFYKFSEYVVVDRGLGMVHMYSRKGTIPGRFVYIKNKFLEALFNDYRKKKERSYSKRKSFGGSFPNIEKYFNDMHITIEGKPNCTLDDYEKLKDEAIQNIGKAGTVKINPYIIKHKELQYKIGQLKFPIETKKLFCDGLGISRKTLDNWRLTQFDTNMSENSL